MALVNQACVIDCIAKSEVHPWTSQLLRELTGCEGSEITWDVENKYYSATIRFSVTAAYTDLGVLGKNSDAILLIFAPTVPESFHVACSTWEQMVPNAEPGIKLLVGADEGDIVDEKLCTEVQLWCVDNGFEFVRWTRSAPPSASASQAAETAASEERADHSIADPFVELEGVARVREALHAHMWPILKMKVNPPPPSEAQSAGIPADNDVAAEEPSVQQIVGGLLADAKPGLPDAKEGAGVQEQEEAVESFEELFSRFAAMKAHAQNLSNDERRAYAEKVTMAFWKAIGGKDDDEEEDEP
ncbi:hypothetical protein EMCRGX_G022354 [Ephydatia muelleri]